MPELTLSDVPTDVQVEAISELDAAARPIADAIIEGGLRPSHFEGLPSSEVFKTVQAVASQLDLTYDQVQKFPGYGGLTSPLRLWLEFVFVTRIGMADYRDLVHRVAVVCYPTEQRRLPLEKLTQDLGSIPLAVVHGHRYRGRTLFRLYEPMIGPKGLEISEKGNTVARNLADAPGVTALLDLARSAGYRTRERVQALEKSGKTKDEAFAAAREEALPLVQSKLTSMQSRGIVYESFPQATGPRINLCDDRLMRTAIRCMRTFRQVLRAEKLREQIQQICRRYSTTRATAISKPEVLGRDRETFLARVQERRDLLQHFRTTGPVIPDYSVEFAADTVAESMKQQAIVADEETALLPADLINETEDPAASYRMAMSVTENWQYIAQWETRGQTVTSLKFEDGAWVYQTDPFQAPQTVTPEEFADLFGWYPKPLAIIKPKPLDPEDLQIRENGLMVDLATSQFRDGNWR